MPKKEDKSNTARHVRKALADVQKKATEICDIIFSLLDHNENIIIPSVNIGKEKDSMIVALKEILQVPMIPLLHGRYFFTCQKCGISWVSTQPAWTCPNRTKKTLRHRNWWVPKQDNDKAIAPMPPDLALLFQQHNMAPDLVLDTPGPVDAAEDC